MDGPRVCHTERSKSERDLLTYLLPYANAYTRNLKKKHGTDEPTGRAGIKTQT